jgi:hypothetical protein
MKVSFFLEEAMRRSLCICAGVVTLASLTYLGLWLFVLPYLDAKASVRFLSTPEAESGFGEFDATVLHSEREWEEFLHSLKTSKAGFLMRTRPDEWFTWFAFENGIRNANLDFGKEALVLVPVAGSPSHEIGLDLGELRLRRLTCTIWRRRRMQLQLPAVTYHCFAIAADKEQVHQIEITLPGGDRKLLILRPE